MIHHFGHCSTSEIFGEFKKRFQATEDATMKSVLFALFLAVPAIMGYEMTELTDDSWTAEIESMDTALGKNFMTSIV